MRRRHRFAFGALVVAIGALVVATATAAPEDENKDEAAITQLRKSGIVVSLGKAYLAFAASTPFAYSSEDPHAWFIYYGDGKTFHRLGVYGETLDIDKKHHEWVIRDSRFARVTIVYSDGTYRVTCGEKAVDGKALPEAEARKRVAKAKFEPPRMSRQAQWLARKDTVYFLVDRGRDDMANDFHVYVGKRGAMRAQKLVDLAVDAHEMVFVTKAGTLRFLDQKTGTTASWQPIKAKSPSTLSVMPVVENKVLIYAELGAYVGRFGTPCDDI